MYIQRLEEAIQKTNSVACLGLDPFIELYPPSFIDEHKNSDNPNIHMTKIYMESILEIAQGLVPVVKPQSAFFEAMGIGGIKLYNDLIIRAKEMGFIVIADVKRGDIGTTAEAYAKAYMPKADAVTVNPYMGSDSVEPFIQQAKEHGCGLYVLVRTSNPSAGDLQDFKDSNNKSLFEHTAEKVHDWGKNDTHNDLSCVGAVVGATWPDQGRDLRKLMPNTPFLIPGYGAQGGGREGVKACCRPDGRGILVNSSRGILYAWRQHKTLDWKKSAQDAIKTMNNDLGNL